MTSNHKLERRSRLIVASHNPGKVWEIQQLIAPYGLDAVSAADLDLPEPEETETSFSGNAKLKAVAAATNSGLPALADDSGLEVECLGGAPGIFSARWAGPKKDFGIAMKKVADEITTRQQWIAPGPKANFISVLCLAWPDGETRFFEGKVFGHLVWPPRGGNGFGYDPMFVAEGKTQTFGEMEPEQKYAISHRTRAFAAFKAEMLEGIQKVGPSASKDVDNAGRQAAAANLSTRSELITFVRNLAAAAVPQGSDQNELSPASLNRIASWLEDSADDEEPKWRLVAKCLLAAQNAN